MLVSELASSGRAQEVTLEPLSRDGAAALLERVLGRSLARGRATELWRDCAGTPLLLEAAGRSLAEGRLPRQSSGGSAGDSSLLLTRFVDVDGDGFEYVKAGAIFGVFFDHAKATALSGVPATAADDALERLVRAGVLEGPRRRCAGTPDSAVAFAWSKKTPKIAPALTYSKPSPSTSTKRVKSSEESPAEPPEDWRGRRPSASERPAASSSSGVPGGRARSPGRARASARARARRAAPSRLSGSSVTSCARPLEASSETSMRAGGGSARSVPMTSTRRPASRGRGSRAARVSRDRPSPGRRARRAPAGSRRPRRASAGCGRSARTGRRRAPTRRASTGLPPSATIAWPSRPNGRPRSIGLASAWATAKPREPASAAAQPSIAVLRPGGAEQRDGRALTASRSGPRRWCVRCRPARVAPAA